MDTQDSRTPEAVTQLRWASPDNTILVAHITLQDGTSFDASIRDGDLPHVQHVWTKAIAGDYGPIAAYEQPAPQIPDRVSSRQFKLQVHAAGLQTPIEAWIAAQDTPTQIAYASAATFVRTDPMLQAGFAALGFTVQQIDDFYVVASQL